MLFSRAGGMLATLLDAHRKTRELFAVVGRRVQASILLYQTLLMSGSVVELLSLVSIVPFLGIMANPELFADKGWMLKVGDFLGAHDQRTLTIYLGLISLTALVTRHVVFHLIQLAGNSISLYIRSKLFNQLVYYYMNTDYEFHLRHHSGLLSYNLLHRTGSVYDNMLVRPLAIIQSLFYCFLSAAILIWNDAILAFMAIATIGAGFSLYLWLSGTRLNSLRENAQILNNELNRNLHDSLLAIEDIKVQHKSGEYTQHLSETMRAQMSQNMRIGRITSLFAPIMEIAVYGVVILLMLYYVQKESVATNITSLALFGLFAYRALPHVRGLHSNISRLMTGLTSYGYVREDILDAFKYAPPQAKAPDVPDWRFLEYKKVHYSYADSQDTCLENINLRMARNSKIGFCGLSGSGKTTLIRLLLGLLEPTQGSLLVDGKSLHSNDRLLSGWQQSVAYVSQNIAMLNASIAHNVALALKSHKIDRQRVKWALECAQLKEFVEDMPQGIDSIVMQAAKTMSTGQKQRLAIARALYRKTDVLILDEGTSSLDGDTEANILNAVQQSLQHSTLIMIAHRINTIRSCDIIYVMQNGQIVDQGTYDELYSRNEYFRKLSGFEQATPTPISEKLD